ncbi:DUF3822 family protein [Parapedobacter lycopersici]|uniref:DUF3822 family protein n=1 Tax=Parapedobacter lycopersici TaxID=1864939 RepID=UPI00333E1BBC
MNHIYTSTDFDSRRAADYTLLVRVGQSADTLAVVDNQSQLKFFAVAGPQQQVEALDGLSFGQVRIAAADHSYSFVPEAAYDAALLPVYGRFLVNDGLTVPEVSPVAPYDVRLVYQLNRLGLERYTAAFPEAAIYSKTHAYLCSISGRIQGEERLLTVDITGDANACIGFFADGKLHYCNDFEIHEPADLHYYMLAVLEHLGLSDGKLPVLLSGDIAAGDPYYSCLTTYSDTITWADLEELIGIAGLPDLQQDQHRFLSLFGLLRCV